MHLEIIQSTDRTETVSAQTIDKLYRLAFEDQSHGITSQLDATSNVLGRLEAAAAYEDAVRYLAGIDPGDTKRFQNLYITVTNQNYYVRFEDPVVRDYCIQRYGDGVGMTKAALSGVTLITLMWSGPINKGGMSADLKSLVISLNDFLYFTGMGAYNDSGTVCDMSNATSIKFPSCTFSYTSIYTKNVVSGCPNLSTIDYSNAVFVSTNSGTILPINGNNVIQEWNASLLPNQTSFRNVELFRAWLKLLKVIFPEGVTATYESFNTCKALQYVEYPSTVTDIGDAFNFARDSNHNIPCIVIKAVSPPTWTGWNESAVSSTNTGFGYIRFPAAIYVPDGSVTAYTSVTSGGTNNESAWASPRIQQLILPMSLLPQLYRDMGTVTQADIDRT